MEIPDANRMTDFGKESKIKSKICVAFKVFGCKVNQYDTHALRTRAEELGFEVVSPDGDWDAMVVGTCAVTERALAKARRFANQALSKGMVVATGCAPRLCPDFFENPGGMGISAASPLEALDALRKLAGMDAQGSWDGHGIRKFFGHRRAFLKVGDGCPGGCTYCIIPMLRGPSRSRPPLELVAEAARLAGAGHPEIVLTAIHLGLYGRDLAPPSGLLPLLRMLESVPGVRRLRLSSIEILEVSDDLARFIAGSPLLAKHLHIPLQSGDGAVLGRMGRKYAPAEFLSRLARIREFMHDVSISTDVMTGFPGEDEASFRRTCEFVEEAGFSRLHVFPFSPRPGTRAWEWRDDPAVRAGNRRSAVLVDLGLRMADRFRRRFIGKEVEVLVEEEHAEAGRTVLSGKSSEYLSVSFEGMPGSLGRMVRVVPVATTENGLRGEMR